MSVLDRLKGFFVSEQQKPKSTRKSADQTELRRKKFVSYLNEQKKLAQNPPIPAATAGKKKGKRSKAHFWPDADLQYVFTPRYGTSPVVVYEGKPHIKVKDLQELISFIDGLVEATDAGELDSPLAKAAEKKRKPVESEPTKKTKA